MQNYHIHISSKHKMFDLKLKEVWRYRDLIWLFTKRSFTVTYKQTVLGPIWLFINPIITSLIYTFVFGGIAGMDTDGVPQLLFYLSGNAMWTLFSSSLTKNASTFTSNAGVFGKVYFPRLVAPLSTVTAGLVKLFIQFLLFAIVYIYFVCTGVDVCPNWYALLFPVLIVLIAGLALGFGIIVSSLTTKYRDLTILFTFVVQLWMYGTPIIYPLSTITNETLKFAMMLNPITAVVETFKYGFLGVGEFSWGLLGYSFGFMIVVLTIGIVIFNKVQRSFMDTV